MIASSSIWFWPLFFAVIAFGLVRVALAARRGQALSARSPIIDSHRGLFVAAVVALIVIAGVWLALQSL